MAQKQSISDDKDEALRALILIASLDAFSPDYSDISAKAKEELRSYPDVDKGLLVALGAGSRPDVPSEPSEQAPEVEPELTISNYPNPSNPATTISFTLPHEGRVRLQVYDILGRMVRSLVDEVRSAGTYQSIFDGSQLPSGVYIYRLEFEGTTISKKLLLTK